MGTKRSLIAEGRSQPSRLIGATLLLSLAIILFFAVLPLSHPAGAGRGSAFNPGNDVVALNASTPPGRAVFERGDRRDPPAIDAGGAVLPAVLIILPFMIVVFGRLAIRDEPIARSSMRHGARRARAPPTVRPQFYV